MRFRLFGTEIYLSFLFAALLTIMLATDKTGLVLPTFFAVFMHECGHLFAMWILGCAPKKIKLIPASVQITNAVFTGYKNDFLIAISGPLVNFILFLALYYNYSLFENQFVGYFALINLVLGIFNLLPVKGLDGGTAFLSLLCKFTDINKAEFWVKILSFTIAITVLITALILTIRGKSNITLFIIGAYLIIMSVMKM